MTEWQWLVILLIAVVAAVSVFLIRAESRRQSDAQAAALREQVQNLVAAHSQAVSAQIGQLNQLVTTQLGQVTQQVQNGMASAGTAAAGAQKAVSEQLQASTEMLGVIRQQLGEVQQAGRELSGAARQIENVLGGAKTRGMLGEVALERILADTLPPAAYRTQHRFSTGEIVDAIVRLDDRLLPIDSKFPLEDYRRLAESGEDARKGFSQAVRAHADSISRKYILPGEGTLDIALMFVPSESVYYEMLRSSDSKGTPLDQYCRDRCVMPVSPNTLFAYLRIVAVGLRGLQIEENAKRLLASLAGLKKQMEDFSEVYMRLGTHLRNAQQSYSDADRRLDRARNRLEELAEGAPAEKLLESASGN